LDAGMIANVTLRQRWFSNVLDYSGVKYSLGQFIFR